MSEKSFKDTYCGAVMTLPHDDVNRHYHDYDYGYPIQEDHVLFGRLILEINQAGLSWTTILRKEDHFKNAYANYCIQTIANYNEDDRRKLLNNPGIIRNKLKINAAVYNANQVIELQKDYGSFKAWLDAYHPQSLEAWTKLFKKTFKFVGGKIVEEFLMSTGYLDGAHHEACPIYKQLLALSPPWMVVKKK